MAVEILMPELGESVHEGTVSRWLKKEGDFVKEDEPVVEIMTDKVNTELGATASGVLSKILIQEGNMVEVFKAMGIIDETATASAAPVATTTPEPQRTSPEPQSTNHEPQATDAEPQTTSHKPPATGHDEKRFYTPVVMSIAKEKGLTEADLATIAGTGEGGRVTKKDVESYIAAPQTATPEPVASSEPPAAVSP